MNSKQRRNLWKHHRATLVMVAALLSINIAYFAYWQVASTSGSSDLHPQYGERFEPGSITDLSGNAVTWNGKWLLAFYFDHEVPDSLRLAKYAEVLHRRHDPERLRVVGL